MSKLIGIHNYIIEITDEESEYANSLRELAINIGDFVEYDNYMEQLYDKYSKGSSPVKETLI